MVPTKASVLYIFFKYCADVENLFFKYCADVENCDTSKGFGFIYIYIDYSATFKKNLYSVKEILKLS